MTWLTCYWATLCAGKRVELRLGGTPEDLGFHRIAWAEQNGQIGDWAMSMDDGSRLHLWLMPDGRWLLHRDSTDPTISPLHAIVHVVTETKIGAALVLARLAVGVGSLFAVSRR